MKGRLLLFLIYLIIGVTLQAQLTYETLWVQYDSAWVFKNLKLIPVRFKSSGTGTPLQKQPGSKLISLAEAMLKGKVHIREMQAKEGASVNSLEIVNTSKDHILVNTGDLLGGGKQDRIVAETKVIPPGKTTTYLDVFCVEKGRWDDKPGSFKNKGTADARLKKVMDKTGRQSEVWKEIQRQFGAEKKTSDTWPYLALANSRLVADSDYVRYFTSRYKASDSLYAGFIAITGNRIVSTELFASAEMTALRFADMLNVFVQDAVSGGSTPVMNENAVKRFMDKLLTDEASQREFVAGRGKIFRFENKVIHIVVYGD